MWNEEECKKWANETSGKFLAPEGLGGYWGHIPSGCVSSSGKTHYNRTSNQKNCGSGSYNCVNGSTHDKGTYSTTSATKCEEECKAKWPKSTGHTCELEKDIKD